jgi:hypothetical protein
MAFMCHSSVYFKLGVLKGGWEVGEHQCNNGNVEQAKDRSQGRGFGLHGPWSMENIGTVGRRLPSASAFTTSR